ncbi:cellulose-binding domain-containing protein [Microbispora sp. NPDC046933]|uniref:cellulose-binding domain-containing protein n=1 Tax=Microbispora sp. NPDC046933 TaxID=3155618 RepID=UPI0033FA5FB5
MRPTRFFLGMVSVLVLGTTLAFGTATPAGAAVACTVTYSTNDWTAGSGGGGFTAAVTVQNLGDPVNGWTLGFTFPSAGQKVTEGWSATWSQSGQNVTARNLDWNAALARGSSVSLGFNGTWSGTNPKPSAFTLNGTACTGATQSPTPSSTPSPTPSPTRTPSPSPSPTPTRSPSPSPSPSPGGNAWNPPANLVTPLNEVWRHEETTYPDLYGFKNYIWDQIMAGRGSINYCVRWDSSATVSASLRDRIHASLARSFNKWIDQLEGWSGWPYPDVNVKVVGWAVRDRNQLQWTDNSVDVYVGDINEGAPQCSPPCGRFFHQNGDYSGCPGGAAHHYDMSLWLTAGMNGGAGGDWGQRIGSEYYVGALDSENIHILLHEIGHGFGLDDFYDWTPTGVCCFIMNAGSATQITEFDKWMLRDWWRHLKSRYGY